MKHRLMKKVVSLMVLFSLLLSLVSPNFLGSIKAYADETMKIDLSILTDFKPEAEAKKVYWTGEGINASADLTISGTGVSIENPKTVITVPKVKANNNLVINRPTFVKSATAVSWEVTEDEDNFYATYNFSTLKGGQQITIPFPFSFKNDITPGGTTVTPTYEIFDSENRSLRKAEITYTAQVTPWNSDKYIEYYWHMHDRRDTSNNEYVEAVVRQEYRDRKADETMSRDVQFVLAFRPLQGHSTLGKYTPEIVKIVDKLPPNATLTQRSIDEGWIYNANDHTATWEGKLTPQDSHGERRLVKSITLRINNQPVYLNQTGTRDVPNEYVFKNKADFWINPNTAQEEKLPERYANGVFEAYETVTPPFARTRDFHFDAWGGNDGSYSPFYNFVEKDLTRHQGGDKTVHFNSKVENTNNGSAYDNPNGGITDDIKRITWDLDEKLYFKYIYINANGNKANQLREQYNSTGKTLYGITRDGQREVIPNSETLQLGSRFYIDNEKYKSLVLEFDDKITLDNSLIGLHTETYPRADEKAMYDNRIYKNNQRYFLWMSIDAKRSDEENFINYPKERERYTHNNWTDIKFPNPQIGFYGTEGNYTVPYGDDNIRRIKIGPHLTGNWVGMDVRQKVKQITLLPSGIVFKEHKGVDWADPRYRNIEPKIVDNFRNTGKTAVIYEYELNGDGEHYNHFRGNFDVDTTIYANSGNNVLEHFVLWENNDIVKPNSGTYKDALDLDGDGNFDEVFMRTTTTINFIPPLEVIAKKTVSLTPVVGGLSAPSQDIGKPVFYHINILNNTIRGLDTLSVIDVLPYVGDHKIAPNDAGEYLPRNSQFNMSLTNSVESVAENARVLERFDVYYSLTPQGADLASVRDAQWLRADEITDFTQVKSVKFVLKQGSVLNKKEEVGFFLPSAIPYDEDLENGSTSRNSVAFSTNNFDYIEANEATASNIKYTVDGVVFFDKNREGENNGKLNDDDIKLGGYTAQLMNEDGTPYLDYNNKPVTAVTDSKGYYSMKVYARGKYFVQFTKKDSNEVFTQQYEKVGNGGNDAVQNDTDELKGNTPVFELDPLKPHGVRNAGILLAKGQVSVLKKNEDGAPLQGVKFKLKDKNSDFEQELATNAEGLLTFEELKFSDYTLEEVETLKQYVKTEAIDEFTLTQEDSVKQFEKINNFKKANVTLTKVDKDDPNQKLKDVEFGLYQSDSDEPKYRATTDDDGIATFENVRYGTYELKEIATILGYVLKTQKIEDVTISTDGQAITIEAPVTNEKIKANVSITKVDADEASVKLEGVVFGLYKTVDNKEVLVKEATTNDEGIATFEKVAYGTYYVKEKEPKEGYVLSEVIKDVTIDSAESKDLGTVTNTKIKGTITFKKVDAEERKALEGAIFGLYEKTEGEEKPPEKTARSNDQGIVRFEEVSYGNYYVKEISPKEGYEASTNKIDVPLFETDGQTLTLEDVSNEKIKATITIEKVDKDYPNLKLKGASFELVSKTDPQVKYEAETNEDGIATFSDVPYGKYTLSEVEAPKDYILNTKTREIDIKSSAPVEIRGFTNEIKKGSVTLTKVDADDTSKPLEGVEFALIQDGKDVYKATSDGNGVVTFDEVRYGDYKLVEKTPLVNYVKDETKRDVTISEDTPDRDLGSITNTLKKGSVTLVKVDADDETKPLEGVEFVLKQGDNEVYKESSDENGEVTFEHVVYGEYTLVEKTPLPSYNQLEKEYPINISANGQVADLGTITNQIKKGSVSIIKVAALDSSKPLADDNKKTLKGITFILEQDGEEKYRAITNEEGKAHFTSVSYGDYELKEIETLENYNLSDETRTVEVREDGEEVKLGEFENTIKKGKVTLIKVDADDERKTLEGVTFVLTQEDKEVYEATSDKNGVVSFEEVVYGDYELKEKATIESHNLSKETRKVKIREEGELVEVGNITNQIKKGTITFVKVDQENPEIKLAGTLFELYPVGSDTPLMNATSNDKGIVTFSKVPYGDYLLKEKSTIEGYNLNSETREVQIRAEGEKVELSDFTNKMIRGDISVTKVDKDDNTKRLKGVVFALMKDGKELERQTTDEAGMVRFKNIPYGKYSVAEKIALDGYIPSTEAREVRIIEEGKTVSIDKWENEPIRSSGSTLRPPTDEPKKPEEVPVVPLPPRDNIPQTEVEVEPIEAPTPEVEEEKEITKSVVKMKKSVEKLLPKTGKEKASYALGGSLLFIGGLVLIGRRRFGKRG